MNAYLGVDIGTYELKGVLVDREGKVLASTARPHELIVPRAGWAEHRAEEDWWGDFVWLTRALIAESGIAPLRSGRLGQARSVLACCRSTPKARRYRTQSSTASIQGRRRKSRI